MYEGRPVEELEKRRAALEIGFVFQSPDAQIVTDRVSSELAFGLENAGVPPEEIRRRVAEMAGFFGIEAVSYTHLFESVKVVCWRTFAHECNHSEGLL